MQDAASLAQTTAKPDYWHAKKGIVSWLTTTDHKRIGIMYLFAIGFFFLFAVAMGIMIRLELFSPGAQMVDGDGYNRILYRLPKIVFSGFFQVGKDK